MESCLDPSMHMASHQPLPNMRRIEAYSWPSSLKISSHFSSSTSFFPLFRFFPSFPLFLCWKKLCCSDSSKRMLTWVWDLCPIRRTWPIERGWELELLWLSIEQRSLRQPSACPQFPCTPMKPNRGDEKKWAKKSKDLLWL